MLSDVDVAQSLLLLPGMDDSHPLKRWLVGYDTGLYDGDLGPEDRWKTTRFSSQLVDIALNNREDPYCDAVGIGLVASPMGDVQVNARTDYLENAYYRLHRLADIADEPILQYWVADAALEYHKSGIRAPYRAELEVLAWRMALEVESTVDPAFAFFVDSLRNSLPPEIDLAAYCGRTRLRAAQHLYKLAPHYMQGVVVGTIADCLSAQAVANARLGRYQGVADCYKELDRQLLFLSDIAEATPVSESRVTTDDEYDDDKAPLGEALRQFADAFLYVGRSDEALEVMARAAELDPYAGAEGDVALLNAVVSQFVHGGE